MDVDHADPTKWVVRLRVQAEGAPFTLALRLPGWSGDHQLRGAAPAEVTRRDGYLYISKAWSREDEITLTLSCPVRFLRADTRVRENAGKIAVMHGPFVYCLEEKDNGGNLHLLSIPASVTPADAAFEVAQIAGCEATLLKLPGLRAPEITDQGLYFDEKAAPASPAPVALTLIPYFMWANRGENEMQVWIRKDNQY
jgi:hypothetical protein